jgi:hypothetical protein
VWAKKSDKKHSIRSSFVRIARRLGFLSEEEAEQADELIGEDDLEQTSQDLVVSAGLLNEEQAQTVEQERKTEDLDGHLEDKFKRASLALADTHTSAAKLCDATQPLSTADVLAAKKKAGIG